MEEHHTLPHTLAGLRLLLHVILSHRAQGFTTAAHAGTMQVGKRVFRTLHLTVTPPARPTREERGADIPKEKL